MSSATVTLAYQSDQDQTAAMLWEDGLLVPNTGWYFSAANKIVIDPYNAAAVYTMSYNLLYQVTTDYIDLSGVTATDYILFADYMLWDRLDKVQGDYPATVPLYFNPNNGRAALPRKSDMDMAAATLVVQDGVTSTTVSQRYWRFLSPNVVEIDINQMVEGAQYFITLNELKVYAASRLTVTFEHRSGTTQGNCSVARWSTIERNENVRNDHDFHQLRLSISGIRDLRDFRIRSLVIKGLHAFGANAWVPALTEPA